MYYGSKSAKRRKRAKDGKKDKEKELLDADLSESELKPVAPSVINAATAVYFQQAPGFYKCWNKKTGPRICC